MFVLGLIIIVIGTIGLITFMGLILTSSNVRVSPYLTGAMTAIGIIIAGLAFMNVIIAGLAFMNVIKA